MSRLVGIPLIILLLTVLPACGSVQSPSAVPPSREAPITHFSGVISGEARMHGILAYTGGVYSDGTQRFLQPAIPFEFDANGSFNVALPTVFTNDFRWADDAGCGLDGTALLGLVMASDAPFVDGSVPSKNVRGWYRRETSSGVIIIAWYSPVDMRVRCEHENDRMTYSDHLSIDLRLVAGWNEVGLYKLGGRAYFRSGAVVGVEWRPGP